MNDKKNKQVDEETAAMIRETREILLKQMRRLDKVADAEGATIKDLSAITRSICSLDYSLKSPELSALAMMASNGFSGKEEDE